MELLVNGVSMGKQELNHNRGTDFTAHYEVPYTKGEICAIAYDKDGNEVARESKYSFGDATTLKVKADKTELMAGTRQLAFVEISVCDEEGHPVENAMNYVEVRSEGPIRLMGLDNGDSTDYDPYKCNVRKLFNGKLLAIVGADGKDFLQQKAMLTVSGRGLTEANNNKLTAKHIKVIFKIIYDKENNI